jgi:hypothetical protein
MRDGSRVGLETFGPFQSHDDFHQFLRGGGAGIPMEAFENMTGIEKVNSHRQHYATKFTHGDFAPRNIMVKRTVQSRLSLIGIALVGFPSTGNTRKRCSHPMRRMTG